MIITEKIFLKNRFKLKKETKAIIIIKDHKNEFARKTQCCLINASKSSIGKISKPILNKAKKR